MSTCTFFDRRGTSCEHAGVLTRKPLRARHGVSIDLPAGNYTVVCLGNAGERTQVSDLTTCDLHMMFFAHPGYFMNDESMLTGNDPLYHGDLRFEGGGREVSEGHR